LKQIKQEVFLPKAPRAYALGSLGPSRAKALDGFSVFEMMIRIILYERK